MSWAGIPSEQIPDVWPLVEPLIQSVLDTGAGECDARDIYIDLLQGRAQLWICGEEVEPGEPWKAGIIVTEDFDVPNFRILNLRLIAVTGGFSVFKLHKEMEPVISEYARARGCAVLRSEPHVEQFEKKYFEGWTKVRVVLEKKL